MKNVEVIDISQGISKAFGLSGLNIKEVKIVPSIFREICISIDVINNNSFDELHKIDEKIRNYLSDYDKTYKIIYKLNFIDNKDVRAVTLFLIEKLKLDNKMFVNMLNDIEIDYDKDKLFLLFKNKLNMNESKENRVHFEILKLLLNVYGIFNKSIEYKLISEMNAVKKTTTTKKEIKEKEVTINYNPIIIDLELGKVIESTGEVFDIVIKEITTKNNAIKKIYSFYITDYNKSIICRKFYNKDDEVNIEIGDIVEVKGIYKKEEVYTKEYYVDLRSINKLSKVEKIVDNAEVKRVELNLKTNMSEMTSNINSKKLTSKIKEMGYTSYAVTDLGVVHSYPFLFNKYDDSVKVIFGIEAYVVDDNAKLVINPKNVILEEETYVIFDIETTGLDPYNDKIIEIGAIKMEKLNVVDKFSTFINPEVPISEFITNLTSISNDDVKDAETIDKVLPKFLEFIGNATLVAQNANFDVGFITEKSKQLGIKTNFSYIDTIQWAKLTLPDQKRFNLDALCKTFNIVNEFHHRAINDAEVTAKIFKILLQKVSVMNVNTLKDVNDNLQLDIKIAPVQRTDILVKNKDGLKKMYELVSKSFLEFYGKSKPRIPKSLLEKYREYFLISSAPIYNFGDSGELISLYIRGIDKAEIEEAASFYDYIQLLPVDCYIKEIETKEVSNEDYIKEMNIFFYNLGKKLNKKVVAVGNVMYMDKKESKAKSVLQIANGEFKASKYQTNAYFRTTDEMLSNFSYLGEKEAYEVVVENTNYISSLIDVIKPIPDGFYPPKIEGSKEAVKEITYKKAFELYGENIPAVISERIKKELNSIINNGFSVLYLIAQKLVKKSVDSGYLVGSRGSVGSSIVAYLMGITEVNGLAPHYRCPNKECKNVEIFDKEISGVDLEEKNCPKCNTKYIRDGHAIPFEVFMGFNGDKVPDIDLNFSGEFQSEIHRYTEELFGAKNVFRAGTISTTAENNAIGYVRKYFEEINKENIKEECIKCFGEYNNTAEQESFRDTLIKNYFIKNAADIKRLAKLIEGTRKTTGQHPGGMVVVPNDMSVYDFTPIQKPANDITSESTTTHFDYHVMDEQLVKLDILGHDDPTTLKMLEDLTGVSPYEIPLTDKKVLSIFTSTEALNFNENVSMIDLGTNGIPELGTNFVKEMLKDTKPTTFTELVRISGLSHGTDVWLNNAKDYVNQKIATLSEIITVRDDIMNYLILQGMEKSLAFKIMEFVRKGKPSKDKEQWGKYKEEMRKVKAKDWYIESCEKIKYMFPKGHAVAYVMMAIRIAYFKVYYPLEFYTSYLNRKVDSFTMSKMYKDIDTLKYRYEELNAQQNKTVNDKKEIVLLEILIEMYYRGIELLPVDLYKSEANTFVINDGKIRIPFIGVDQLGEIVAKKIVSERQIKFTSKEDFMKRTKINNTVMNILNKYKVLDGLSETDQQTLF